jgi:hypothetical protein
MKSIILSTGGLIAVLFLALLTLHNMASRAAVKPKINALSTRFRGAKGKHRIAIVIPFFGESPEAIPPYLNLFCTAASGSASLVDFLIVHNGVLEAYTEPVPSNVKFLNVGSTKEFIELLVRVVDRKQESELAVDSLDKLVKIVSYHVHQYPYVLVEFKPATGHIFASLLEGYSHWGYADLDIAFGDLPRWISEEELTDYDIVTYGYGDQNRIYLRGQFTFHKNSERINQLWRECSYLSSMDERFAQVIAGKKKLRVESAEGCYSAAILKRKDIRVKYAVKAFTDINAHDSVNTHGLYLGIGSKRDRSVIYKAGSPQDGKSLLKLSPTWFEDTDTVYGSKERATLQRLVGKKELVPVSKPEKTKCMFWVPESYQSDICISGVGSNETLFWIDGKLYKQPFENTKLPGNVVSRPFFHFQEWKRYYRSTQLATVHHSTEALGWVLVREGAIPIFPKAHLSRWATLVSPLGHSMTKWDMADNSNRKMLPHARYCLRSGPRKSPPQPVVTTCFKSVSWQDQERVEILHGAPVWQHIDVKREVTLALTLQITPKQAADSGALHGILGVAIANINAWQGQPCVIVIHITGATPESKSIVTNRFAQLETDATLVAMISQEEANVVSRRALLNMANDAAPTRWVVSGLEIERGLVLSSEASALAYRRAKVHGDLTGTVLVIPQFAINDEDGDGLLSKSFNDLAEMRRTGEPVVYGPDEYDVKCQGDEENKEVDKVLRPAHKLWWKLSTKETTKEYVPHDEASFRELALALDDMQLSFTKLLAKENEIELVSLDSSPILMTDSIGPHKGMRTSEMAREVEEFGGTKCYNGLRLAQLAALGYSMHVMTGAFAISTSSSRHESSGHVVENSTGSSRCDSCFMFDHEHESILRYITTDERVRPAKASILWNDIKTQSVMIY